MYGSAIYFADKKETARHKARGSNNAIVVADVDMGKALIIEGIEHTIDLNQLREVGCDSVLGRKNIHAEWEYVVYDPKRIKIIRVEYW